MSLGCRPRRGLLQVRRTLISTSKTKNCQNTNLWRSIYIHRQSRRMFFLESPSPLLVIKQINIYDRNRCSKSLMYDYHDRYGKYIPELVPGSHCGYNELQRIATGLAMQKHRQLITRLTEKCRMVTNGLKVGWF